MLCLAMDRMAVDRNYRLCLDRESFNPAGFGSNVLDGTAALA